METKGYRLFLETTDGEIKSAKSGVVSLILAIRKLTKKYNDGKPLSYEIKDISASQAVAIKAKRQVKSIMTIISMSALVLAAKALANAGIKHMRNKADSFGDRISPEDREKLDDSINKMDNSSNKVLKVTGKGMLQQYALDSVVEGTKRYVLVQFKVKDHSNPKLKTSFLVGYYTEKDKKMIFKLVDSLIKKSANL